MQVPAKPADLIFARGDLLQKVRNVCPRRAAEAGASKKFLHICYRPEIDLPAYTAHATSFSTPVPMQHIRPDSGMRALVDTASVHVPVT